MAELVLTDAFVSINAIDLSDHVKTVTLGYEGETQDNTAMSLNDRRFIGGLRNWSLDVEFNQDYAASKVDATMFGIVGTSVALILRPLSTGVSATNPQFTGNAFLENYSPLAGSIGEALMAPISMKGTGALARATA